MDESGIPLDDARVKRETCHQRPLAKMEISDMHYLSSIFIYKKDTEFRVTLNYGNDMDSKVTEGELLLNTT